LCAFEDRLASLGRHRANRTPRCDRLQHDAQEADASPSVSVSGDGRARVAAG